MDLLTWWNLIFLLPALAALLYLVLLATGSVSTGDVDADLDADIDADVDADLAASTDAASAHGIEHSPSAEHNQADSRFGEALGFLGVGRVPLSIILITFCFLWGFAG